VEWSYPRWPIEEALGKSFPALAKELQLAKPDVVVFFANPSYKDSLKLNLPGATFESLPEFNERMLSKVVHENLPTHSYQTYHPKYLNIKKCPDILEKIRSLVLD
jgi:hypothetical protein